VWQYLVLPAVIVGAAGWGLSRAVHGAAVQGTDLRGLAFAAGLAAAGLMAMGPYPLAGWVLMTSIIVACAGTVGDALPGARPWCFVTVLFCALALAVNGAAIGSLKLPFTTVFVGLGGLSVAVTVMWVLFVAWAFSRTASLPGSAIAVGGVTSLTFYAVCLLQGDITGPSARVAALALGGACVGQLVGVRPPAGTAQFSSGLAIGFALGVISIVGALKNTAFLVGVLPVLVLGVPIIDSIYTTAVPLGRGEQGLVVAPREQRLHDLLMARGLSSRAILTLYVAGSVYLCLLALALVALIKVHFLLKAVVIGFGLGVGTLAAIAAVKVLSKRPVRGGSAGGSTVSVLSVPVSCLTAEQALACIEEFIASRSPHMVVTSDSSAIVRAQDDPEFMETMAAADLVTPDGAGIVWMAKLLDLPITERVAGCDLVDSICGLAARKGYAVYLLGGREGVASEAAATLCARHHGLNVVGTHHGYFSEEEERELVAHIRDAAPDVLFVALGIPKQEKWIRAHLEELQVPVCIGVGGSLDVVSGRARRAPKWMQDFGLEWLYRTLREPRRLPRLMALPRFFLMMLFDAWSRRRQAGGADPQTTRPISR
jgi:N-acetylglucosaminyldiphosphoundecaprenol N-acetyl-beta-D-mannosaminyltransferase